MPLDKSFMDAVKGHLDNLEKSEGEGGKEKEATYNSPENYSPSTPQQRTNWNKFLDYLEEKGVGGSEELDKRDKTLGLQHLREFNKANPKNAIDESFIPTVQ